MGIEYVVRAFTILYYIENSDQAYADALVYQEKTQGFPRIEDVLAMVREYKDSLIRHRRSDSQAGFCSEAA
jgi:hypothetical protein